MVLTLTPFKNISVTYTYSYPTHRYMLYEDSVLLLYALLHTAKMPQWKNLGASGLEPTTLSFSLKCVNNIALKFSEFYRPTPALRNS